MQEFFFCFAAFACLVYDISTKVHWLVVENLCFHIMVGNYQFVKSKGEQG